MNRTRIICLWVVLSLIAGCKDGSVLSTSAPQYTAQTLIKVLPYADKDPNAIGTSPIDKDIQYGFRVSMATLIKQQSTLQELIARDKIQQTEWFKHFGKTKVECTRKAIRDLGKNFRVSAQKEGDYIELSMTCGDAEEAALIVNEMVDLFLYSQKDTKRGEVAAKLTELENRRHSVQGDLNLAEKALADVRTRSGITDLEEHSYPHLITARLIRLELERDNYALETKGVQVYIENLKKRVEESVSEQVKDELEANLKDMQSELIMLQGKLEELEKMRNEAKAQKRELDLARVQYEQVRRIRDERVRMLEVIKAQIEKLRIMLDDPETSKVQFVGYAPVPLETGSQK